MLEECLFSWRDSELKPQRFFTNDGIKGLRDLTFSLNLLLKSADDWYTGISKHITKTYEDIYIYIYIYKLK